MQAEAALAACSEALWTAIKQPARQRPTAEEWLAGPHADRLRAIQEVALQRASPADTALALETLQVTAGPCCAPRHLPMLAADWCQVFSLLRKVPHVPERCHCMLRLLRCINPLTLLCLGGSPSLEQPKVRLRHHHVGGDRADAGCLVVPSVYPMKRAGPQA